MTEYNSVSIMFYTEVIIFFFYFSRTHFICVLVSFYWLLENLLLVENYALVLKGIESARVLLGTTTQLT